jgi:hypothetical protein
LAAETPLSVREARWKNAFCGLVSHSGSTAPAFLHCQPSSPLKKGFLRILFLEDPQIQCCGSGSKSTWIWIHLTVLSPDPGAWKLIKFSNKPDFLPFKKAFVSSYLCFLTCYLLYV